MFEAFAEVDIDVDVMGGPGRSPSGARENAYSDKGAERRIKGFTAGIVRKGLRAADLGFPAADGAGNPSKMQTDHGGEKHYRPKGVIFLGDELNSQLFHDRRIRAKVLGDPQEPRNTRKQRIGKHADVSAKITVKCTSAGGEGACNVV
jgi:hypothetical protein